MSIVIKAENVSKAYQIGEFTTGTLTKDIERWVSRIRGKEDTFFKIGEMNDRTVKGKSNIVWSLKDINFNIGKGDAVGIIGRNGAGKSTLLKILSRVTTPTTGSLKVKGRIASLLEVGTGFHPELTGRENIFLNGAILGMRKTEILRKFDEIVDFSGVERYIDTPVKRYSSGMYVRLAFAVAAHLESEILIVDEVLAVGDAEFQKKCLGKMGEVSKGEGRTVLFVSHNMASVQELCKKGIFLKNGLIQEMSGVTEVVESYIKDSTENISTQKVNTNRKGTQSIKIVDSYLADSNLEKCYTINSGDDFRLIISIDAGQTIPAEKDKLRIDVGINNDANQRILWCSSSVAQTSFESFQEENTIILNIPKLPLASGQYSVNINLVHNNLLVDWIQAANNFTVIDGNFFKNGKTVPHGLSNFLVEHHFKIEKR